MSSLPNRRLPSERPSPGAVTYGLLALGVTILALAGYIGYELYPRFDLPATEGAGLLLLAAAAGIASFFSPCAFPLLVTLLARETGKPPAGAARRGPGPMSFGFALAAGAAVFLLLTGIIIGLGGGALFAGVTFTSTAGMTIRAVVGAILIFFGFVQIGLISNPLHAVEAIGRPLARLQARQRRRNPMLGFGIFGFGYLLAGFG